MSVLQLLFLVLGVLYLWECACWLPRGAVGCRTWLGRRWRLAHPAVLLGNQRGGFILAHPLPPLGTLLVSNQLPLSLAPEAVLCFVASSVNPGWRPPQTGKIFHWDQLCAAEAKGKKVLLKGELLLQAASPTLAAFLVQQLRHLAQVPFAKREAAIHQLVRQTLDTKAVERLWGDFQNQTASLRLLTNCLFGYLFIFAPLLIWRVGLAQCWLGLLLGLLACLVAIGVLFYRAHKRFFPLAEDDRFTHCLIVSLSPVTAVRARDLLARPLFETFHPLAVAKVFCPERSFAGYARDILREMRHPGLPVCPLIQAEAAATERYGRAVLEQAIEELLRAAGLNPDELLQPPVPADETCRAYCPRCSAQFTAPTGVCVDCGGMALVTFKP
jgi:hypothetical protein